MRTFTSLCLAVMLPFVMTTSVSGHTSVEYFMPQVPNPSGMIMDGQEDDWGWMDEEFMIGFDQTWDMRELAPSRDAIDFVWYAGWSAPPDNRLYFFIRVQDDTLRILEEDPKRWWSDDHVQIFIDADHSGGNFLGENLDQVNNGQRYHLRVKPLPGQPVAYNSLLEYIDLPEIGWSSDIYNGESTEWFDLAWTLSPPAAQHLATNVSWTIEFSAALWDMHGTSPEGSVRHVFRPDQVIHFGARVGDGDGGETGLKHGMVMNGAQPQAGQKAEYHPDWFLLEDDDSGTAIEANSWGQIKAHLERQLR